MRLLSIFFLFLLSLKGYAETNGSTEKYNGVSLEASKRPYDPELLTSITQLNANYVAIVPYAFIRKSEGKVHYNYSRQWWGEKPEGIIRTIQDAKAQKLKVMLKPQIWVRGDGWPGEYLPQTKQQWQVFAQSYTDYIVGLAKLAQKHEVELFCIGTEFRLVAQESPDFWVTLIQSVRSVYSGQITYAANWDNYENITFWPHLDFIGIDAYFPLSEKVKPTIEELHSAWLPIAESLSTKAKEFHKPILFTEFGYRSIEKAAGKQWELSDKDPVSLSEQSNAYVALFDIFWSKDWFAGGFLWKWHLKEKSGGVTNNRYTPQKKTAEHTIRDYFSQFNAKVRQDNQAN